MRILYYALQWTWGILQNILGSLITLFLIRKPHFWYRNALVTRWNFGGSMGIGMFIFLGKALSGDATVQQIRRTEARILVHEYGHTIQSVILGPLFLFVIGKSSSAQTVSPEKETVLLLDVSGEMGESPRCKGDT